MMKDIFLHSGNKEAYSSFRKDRQDVVQCLITHTCLNNEPYTMYLKVLMEH